MKSASKFLRKTDTASESLTLRSYEVINKMVWKNISTSSRKRSQTYTPHMLTPMQPLPHICLGYCCCFFQKLLAHEWAQMPYKMWRAGGLTKVSKAVGCHVLFSFTKKSSPRKKLEDEKVEKETNRDDVKNAKNLCEQTMWGSHQPNCFSRRQEGFETSLSESTYWVC